MNDAERIFRSYFSTDEDCASFRAQHTVVVVPAPDWGEEAYEVGVVDPDGQYIVKDDKPSQVLVHPHAPSGWIASVCWRVGERLHRDSGPALVYVGRGGNVMRISYRDGVEQHCDRDPADPNPRGSMHFRGVRLNA